MHFIILIHFPAFQAVTGMPWTRLLHNIFRCAMLFRIEGSHAHKMIFFHVFFSQQTIFTSDISQDLYFFVSKTKTAKETRKSACQDGITSSMQEFSSACVGIYVVFFTTFLTRNVFFFIFSSSGTEHRNMPLEDALALIGKKFEEHVREIRERGTAGSARGAEDILPPSSHVHYLLNLLTDNRYLSIDEIDSVINYLNERRKRLVEKRGKLIQNFHSYVCQMAYLNDR